MKNEHVPLLLREFSLEAAMVAPIAIAVVVVILLMFGAKREVATVALVAGLLGAFLIS